MNSCCALCREDDQKYVKKSFTGSNESIFLKYGLYLYQNWVHVILKKKMEPWGIGTVFLLWVLDTAYRFSE